MEKEQSQKWDYITSKLMNEEQEKPADFSREDQQELEAMQKDFQLIEEKADAIDFSISSDPQSALRKLKRKTQKSRTFDFNHLTRYAAIIILSLLIGSLIPYFIHFGENLNHGYTTVTVPKGQMTQLELPDGTEVWLNSETTLRYQGVFDGKTRDVELNGEAFFHVKTDASQPFNIITTKSVVQVTGTSLNVMAYKGEREVTTLVEGKVALYNKNNQLQLKLKPGQSAFFDNHNELEIYEVDTKYFTMWREGKLYVDNMSLEMLSQMLERWYNVKIVFQDDDLKKRRISGTVLKYKPVDQILKILTIKENIQFDIEMVPNDRNVIVLKKES